MIDILEMLCNLVASLVFVTDRNGTTTFWELLLIYADISLHETAWQSISTNLMMLLYLVVSNGKFPMTKILNNQVVQ